MGVECQGQHGSASEIVRHSGGVLHQGGMATVDAVEVSQGDHCVRGYAGGKGGSSGVVNKHSDYILVNWQGWKPVSLPGLVAVRW